MEVLIYFVFCTSVVFMIIAKMIHAMRGAMRDLERTFPCANEAKHAARDNTSTQAPPTFDFLHTYTYVHRPRDRVVIA